MGTFLVPTQIGDLQGHRYEPLQALEDTVASYWICC